MCLTSYPLNIYRSKNCCTVCSYIVRSQFFKIQTDHFCLLALLSWTQRILVLCTHHFKWGCRTLVESWNQDPWVFQLFKKPMYKPICRLLRWTCFSVAVNSSIWDWTWSSWVARPVYCWLHKTWVSLLQVPLVTNLFENLFGIQVWFFHVYRWGLFLAQGH